MTVDSTPIVETQRASLRDRKRIRARQALQRAAIQLVEERGYAATSVDDICDAADVSRSSFFRYFGTKSAVFEADLLEVETRKLLDAETDFSLSRMRDLVCESYRTMDDELFDQERRRIHLLQTIPELRASFAKELFRPLASAIEYCSRILESDPDDPRVRILAGAVFGAVATVQLPDSEGRIELPESKFDVADRIDAAFDNLMTILQPEALQPSSPRTRAQDRAAADSPTSAPGRTKSS